MVIGTDSYIVNATVDDTQIGQIADGDQVDITLSRSGSTSHRLPASLLRVHRGRERSTARWAPSALSAARRSDVTTFPVVIDVTGDPSGLYAGASANVSIIVKQLNNVTRGADGGHLLRLTTARPR